MQTTSCHASTLLSNSLMDTPLARTQNHVWQHLKGVVRAEMASRFPFQLAQCSAGYSLTVERFSTYL